PVASSSFLHFYRLIFFPPPYSLFSPYFLLIPLPSFLSFFPFLYLYYHGRLASILLPIIQILREGYLCILSSLVRGIVAVIPGVYLEIQGAYLLGYYLLEIRQRHAIIRIII
ncbi:hypothetical protein ACJX0J_042294, partial [Zea mays]